MDTSSSGLNYVLYAIYGVYVYICIYVCVFVCVSIYTESESSSVVSDSLRPHGLYSPWNSPGQNIGVGSCFLLQGIFPTQGSNPCLPHCSHIDSLPAEP